MFVYSELNAVVNNNIYCVSSMTNKQQLKYNRILFGKWVVEDVTTLFFYVMMVRRVYVLFESVQSDRRKSN